MTEKAKIRVLVVDDSRMIRDVLTEILNSQPDIEVVGAAADAFEARDMMKSLQPDVVTLDVEMPKMNGLEFLDKLMRARPTPVVMISSATERGSEVTFRALELGAVDFVTKPKLNEQAPDDYGQMIADKIRAAKSARLRPRGRSIRGYGHDARWCQTAHPARVKTRPRCSRSRLTGGTGQSAILGGMPRTAPHRDRAACRRLPNIRERPTAPQIHNVKAEHSDRSCRLAHRARQQHLWVGATRASCCASCPRSRP